MSPTRLDILSRILYPYVDSIVDYPYVDSIVDYTRCSNLSFIAEHILFKSGQSKAPPDRHIMLTIQHHLSMIHHMSSDIFDVEITCQNLRLCFEC